MTSKKPSRATAILFTVLLLLTAASSFSFLPVYADSVTATIIMPGSGKPGGITVNPYTNRIYVASAAGYPGTTNGALSVIDGPTNIVMKTIEEGLGPSDTVVNPSTNKIYVTERYGLQVVNASTNANSVFMAMASGGAGVAANPSTNRIYAINPRDKAILVIDSKTDTIITTMSFTNMLRGIGVNPSTNRVYVTGDNNTVTVIDGSTNAILSTIPVGVSPRGIGVNPSTNRVYIPNFGTPFDGGDGNTVSVIDGSTNTVVSTITVGDRPVAVGVNPNTNKVYVANFYGNSVSVIDGLTNSVKTTIAVGTHPSGVGVNPNTNRIYVSNNENNTISVIDGSSLTTSSRLTINAQDTSGGSLNGYYTVLYQNGAIVATGFSPATFTLNNGQTYTVQVQDYGNYAFDRWSGAGSANRNRDISISSDTNMVAVYRNINNPPPAGNSKITVSTVNSAGSAISGYYTTFWQGSTMLYYCFSPCSYSVANGQTYQVAVADYGSELFNHWNNNTTNRFHTVIVGSSSTTVSLTAVYTP